MKKTPKKPEELYLLKGLLAGLAGGLAGSAAKVVAEKLVPPRHDGRTPPRMLVERAAEAADTPLREETKHAAAQGIHWGFGTMIGGAYGLAAEIAPKVTAWRGGVFGLTVNRVAHDRMMPAMGLADPVPQQPAQQRVSEWVTHVVYGVTTDLVRRAVRNRL